MKHKPWQQGHFDGLCGIYSLLNSMMYLHPGHFNEDDCQGLFAHLIQTANKITPNVVCDGLDFEPLCDVAEALPAFLKTHHKSKVTMFRPFVNEEMGSIEEFFDDLAFFTLAPQACVIIGLGQPWDHWTVVTKVTKKSVRFYDSYGIKRFDRSAFSLEEDPKLIKVDYRETILITRK